MDLNTALVLLIISHNVLRQGHSNISFILNRQCSINTIRIQIRFLLSVSVRDFQIYCCHLSCFRLLAYQNGPDVPQTITLRCRNAPLERCPHMKIFSTGVEHDLRQYLFLIGTSGFKWVQQRMSVGGTWITFVWCEKWEWGEATVTFLCHRTFLSSCFSHTTAEHTVPVK